MALAVAAAACGAQVQAPGTTASPPPPTVTTRLQVTSTGAPIDEPPIAGTYRGKVFRHDEPGTPMTFHLVEIDIQSDEGAYAGTMAHGPVGADTLESVGLVSMPVDVIRDEDTISIHWDPTVGTYEDDTFAQCVWEEWHMTMKVEDDGRLLVLDDGHVTGTQPEESDLEEWWAGCPQGTREMTRATLVRR